MFLLMMFSVEYNNVVEPFDVWIDVYHPQVADEPEVLSLVRPQVSQPYYGKMVWNS